MSSKRIAFIYMQMELTTVPCIMSFLNRIAQSGYEVDLFTFKSEKNKPKIPNVKIYSFSGYYGKNVFLALFTLISAVIQIILYMFRRKTSYQYIVGVHLFGLFVAAFVGLIFRIPIIYYNLEMYFSKELKNVLWKACKQLEICCTKRCTWFITLDKWHARLLSKEHGFPLSRFLILPNTAIGAARKQRSNLLHEMYGIENNKKIILTMGSRFYSFRNYHEILKSIESFPDDYILVVHLGDIPHEIEEQYRSNPKLIIADKFISYDELDNLYSSAYVGLVLYQNDDRPAGGRNQTYMGLSSGQFNFFMKCGIPCITTAQPTFKWIFSNFKCGAILSSFQDISATLKIIEDQYGEYSNGAIKCYEDWLDFDKHFDVFISAVKN